MSLLSENVWRTTGALLIFAAASAADAQSLSILGAAPEEPAIAGTDTRGADDAGIAPPRRCVLIQCVSLPVSPAPDIFNRGAALWTATELLVGAVIAAQGPINDGAHGFRFVDEKFFQYDAYGGGSDKASHFVVSATVADLLSDAYAINGLSENQAFSLSLGVTLLTGVFVEIGDGVTPYGGSAQDLTADALGAFLGAFVKRGHFDDVVGFQLGKVPTDVPTALEERPHVGIDYTHEMYGMNFKFAGIGDHLRRDPGVARYFQLSFVYFTKGFGYEPPVDFRYQAVGIELGLNVSEILKAVGVSDSTWWGDSLLRAARFFRIPYTQVGAYYNFKSKKWYGPEAPYRYY